MTSASSFLEVLAAALVAATGAVGIFEVCLRYRRRTTRIAIPASNEPSLRTRDPLDTALPQTEPYLVPMVDQFRSQLERDQSKNFVPYEEFLGRRRQSEAGNHGLGMPNVLARATSQG